MISQKWEFKEEKKYWDIEFEALLLFCIVRLDLIGKLVLIMYRNSNSLSCKYKYPYIFWVTWWHGKSTIGWFVQRNARMLKLWITFPLINLHWMITFLLTHSEHIRVKKILRKPCIAFVISFVLWCAPFQALIFFSHFAYQKKKIVYSVIFFLLETKKNFIDIIKREGWGVLLTHIQNLIKVEYTHYILCHVHAVLFNHCREGSLILTFYSCLQM